MASQELLTEKEVLSLLRVSQEAIKRFRELEDFPIPHYKVGRRYLYDRAAVLSWAEANARRGYSAKKERDHRNGARVRRQLSRSARAGGEVSGKRPS